MCEAYGEPQRVSAKEAVGNIRAKPKSATLRIGAPKRCPKAMSSGAAGCRSKFCKYAVLDPVRGHVYHEALTCGFKSRCIRSRLRRNLRASASCNSRDLTTRSSSPPDFGCGKYIGAAPGSGTYCRDSTLPRALMYWLRSPPEQ